ncbi:peptidylprolyl isomerase [Candidatus Uhrbacteria bacterium]|nr:peptidylprolyl isomerase [Candidatus Uhrbacteria bacterium]
MTVVLREEPVRPLRAFATVPRSALVVLALSVVCAAAVIGIAAALLNSHVHRGAGLVLARIVPMPAATVDGEIVWYRDVAETAVMLEDTAGLAPEDAIVRAMELAMRQEIMERMAEELGVPVVDDDLAFAATLESAVLASDVYQAESRARLERLRLKLEEGLPFFDIAMQYSEGPSSSVGGDLGYIDPAALPEDLQSVASVIAPGVVEGPVETADAYWLCESQGEAEDEEGKRLVWLRVIEVKKDLLGDVVDREFATATIRQFLR